MVSERNHCIDKEHEILQQIIQQPQMEEDRNFRGDPGVHKAQELGQLPFRMASGYAERAERDTMR